MAGIFLGLGTNLGNRKKNFSQTLNELSSNCDITILKLSSVYRSEPFGVTNQPWFYNMVIEINTQLSPVNLLNVTKDIEKEIGRKKTTRWGPRIIDIDILCYKNEIINQPGLTVPHKQMHLRRFVLIPLKEIAANFIHPQLQKNVDELINECQDELQVKLIINSSNSFLKKKE